jgi:DNA-binding transcriptional ArsR family regulator
MAKKDFQCEQKIADIGSIEKMTREECKQVLAELSKGIAHPARVQIVNILANKPCDQRCICGDIVNALPLAQSSVSQHLRVLKNTGWIHGEISGPSVCYCLVEGIVDFYRSLLTRAVGIEY